MLKPYSFITGNSQTLRFVRELGKCTGLSSAAILGGESIEQQFSVMSGTTPDIIVATPGRFLHICIEMNLKLDSISEYFFFITILSILNKVLEIKLYFRIDITFILFDFIFKQTNAA